RMDLHIVQMLQPDAVLFGYLDRVSCEMREIRRMLVEPSDPAACKNCIVRTDRDLPAVSICGKDPRTSSVFLYNICHCSIFKNLNILKLFHLRKELARDLLSRDILVEQDPRS